MPNSFNKNPETYDPYWPKIFWVSKLDKLCQPVSLKLNEREDKEINIDNINKIIPKKNNNIFFLNVNCEIYSFSYITVFKIIGNSL